MPIVVKRAQSHVISSELQRAYVHEERLDAVGFGDVLGDEVGLRFECGCVRGQLVTR